MANTLETPRGETIELEECDIGELREVLDTTWQTLCDWQDAYDKIEAALYRREEEEG